MRSLLTLLFFFFVVSSFSQKKESFKEYQFLDSIFSDKEKVTAILEIPFDQATKKIKSYDSLINISILLSKEINDSILLAKSYNKKALALHFTSKEKKGIEYALKTIQIYKNLSLNKELGNAYLDLGWKIKYRDLKTAIEYMKRGIFLLEKESKNCNELIAGYNNYGVLLNYDKKIDSAILFHKKSLFLAKKNNDSIGIPFAYTHIASVLLKQKKFTKAKKYLDSSLTIRLKRNDIYGITDSELYLGDLFFEKKDFKKAITHFKKAYQLANKHKFYPLKKYGAELLYKSNDSLNNQKESLKYLKVFYKLKDSILNKSTNDKISELTIKFQTTEKEKEIALQKEEILENELKIKKRNLFATILGAAFLILIILSIGYFHRSQFIKKQLQKEIELKDALSTIKTQNRLQEQRLNISRDLHDNIGSQLTFIISSIDNLKYVTKGADKKLKDKLTSISSFTSDTIFQLRDTIWAMNKSEITIEDLQARVLSFVEKAKQATNNTIDFNFKSNVNSDWKLTSIVGMNLFRVIQEAINNAIKYANASKINISAIEKNQQVTITIKDNGDGFDINQVDLGNGLQNIEKRVSGINGKVFINSKTKEGTEIKVQIPFKNTSFDV